MNILPPLKKLLRRLLLLGSVCVLLLLVMAALLLGTASGLQGSLWLVQKFIPGELEFVNANGRLLDNFSFDAIEYQTADLEITISQIDFSWAPRSLLDETLHIRRLHMGKLNLTATSPEDPEPAPAALTLPEAVNLPVQIRLGEIIIDELRFESNGTQIPLRDIRLVAATAAGSEQAQSLSIQQLQLAGNEFEFSTTGNLGLGGQWPIDLQTDYTLQLAEQPEITGQAQIAGNTGLLTLVINLQQPAITQIDLELRNPLESLTWQSEVQVDALDLSPYGIADQRLGADLTGSGDLQAFDVTAEVNLSGAQNLEFDIALMLARGEQDWQLQKFNLHEKINDARLDLEGLVSLEAETNAPHVDLSGNFKLVQPLAADGEIIIAGELTDYSARINARLHERMPSVWELLINGDTGSAEIEKLHGQLIENDMASGEISLHGQADWQDELPTFDLNGHWNNIAYKLNETDSLRSADGTLSIKGNIDDYSAEITTRLEYPQVPLLDIQLNAHGNASQLQLQPLQIGLLGGQINIESRTSWAETHSIANSISTDFMANMIGLDPGQYWPDWPGELQGTLEGNTSIQLQAETAEWRVGIDTLVVNGQLRNYPLTLTGKAQLAIDDYRLQDVKLQSGDSRLLINGHVGNASNLNWQLDSDNLGEFLPDAGGSISSSGQLAGNINAPQVNFDIGAAAITTPWLSIAEISGKADINAASDRFTVDLDGRGLRQAEQQVDEVSLQVSGLLSQHSLKLNAVMPARSIELTGDGQWQNERWRFDLVQADFIDSLAGHWQLAEPARFIIATDDVDIEQHCWQQSPARACLAADWVAAGDWQARITADGVDLEQLIQANIDADKWTQDWEKFTGTIELELDAAGNSERIARADGELRLQNILLQPTAKAALDMPQLTMAIRDVNDTLVLNLAGTLAGEYPGDIDGMITLGSLKFSEIPTTSVRGNINAAVGDLSPLLQLYPRFDSKRAALTLALELSGQLNTPDINGNAELAIERFGIPELGIEMDELDISIKNTTTDIIDDLQLVVRTNSGPGNILVEGNIQWTENGLLIPELQINGEKFEIANLPEARVLVSPALELRLENQRIDVNGTVAIPEALLQPLYVVTSVPVSGDEIIIGETKPDDQPNPWDIFANIDLNLGDNVRVIASGFKGRVAGDLKLRQSPRSLSAQGELNLVDARYSAYGQELTVNRGTIIFSGQPIDNPAIDARASRSVSGVTVGVTATGSAQQPVVELFSTPSMSQANILSYMITGRPVSGGNADDGNMLLQAATSMGISGTESLRQDIASTFGLDDISLTGGTGADSNMSLTIGKYLAPDIYISYGAGLVESAVNTFRVRYDIYSFLSLEAEQGAGTGVDLLYQIER